MVRFQRVRRYLRKYPAGTQAAIFLLKTVAEQKDIDLIECKIPFSLFDETEVTQAMIDCYGKLSLQTDALFIYNYPIFDPKLLQQLMAPGLL